MSVAMGPGWAGAADLSPSSPHRVFWGVTMVTRAPKIRDGQSPLRWTYCLHTAAVAGGGATTMAMPAEEWVEAGGGGTIGTYASTIVLEASNNNQSLDRKFWMTDGGGMPALAALSHAKKNASASFDQELASFWV